MSDLKMRTSVLAASVLFAFGAGMHISDARAGIVFSDDFNSYAGQLNWVPPANWTVSSGSVDLIGETTSGTSFDFYPGNGGFVDLDGSTNLAGTLQTTASFLAGSYTLTFDLGGNARNDGSKETIISLGSFSQSIILASSAPLQQYSFSFATDGGNLSFADLAGGNANIGNILDNVTLSSDVPEPSTWAMMILGFMGVGFLAYRRKHNRTALRIA
jgi:hypothetical protein